MATGKEIKEVYDMMKTICQETSNLLKVINDMMAKEEFKAVSGGSVMWDQSKHYLNPEFWLPYFLQRVFAKDENPYKGVGINVMFDGSCNGLENSIPFLTCGLLESKNHKLRKSNELYNSGWTVNEEDEKTVDGNLCITHYKDAEVTTTTYFLPLDILNNQEKVYQYIIKPLISLHKGNFDEVNNMIADVAIGLEEIVE